MIAVELADDRRKGWVSQSDRVERSQVVYQAQEEGQPILDGDLRLFIPQLAGIRGVGELGRSRVPLAVARKANGGVGYSCPVEP